MEDANYIVPHGQEIPRWKYPALTAAFDKLFGTISAESTGNFVLPDFTVKLDTSEKGEE